MSRVTQRLIEFLILSCFIFGLTLIIQNSEIRTTLLAVISSTNEGESSNPKALILKKYLYGYRKPKRVEIFNYTKKYTQDVNEIIEMKIMTDSTSDFYITIQFFTDENDAAAPLVAQIRFLDAKSDNLVKEHSINLE